MKADEGVPEAGIPDGWIDTNVKTRRRSMLQSNVCHFFHHHSASGFPLSLPSIVLSQQQLKLLLLLYIKLFFIPITLNDHHITFWFWGERC